MPVVGIKELNFDKVDTPGKSGSLKVNIQVESFQVHRNSMSKVGRFRSNDSCQALAGSPRIPRQSQSISSSQLLLKLNSSLAPKHFLKSETGGSFGPRANHHL